MAPSSNSYSTDWSNRGRPLINFKSKSSLQATRISLLKLQATLVEATRMADFETAVFATGIRNKSKFLVNLIVHLLNVLEQG